MFFGALLRDERRVFHLDVRRIHEHDTAQITRGEGAIDIARITLLDEIGQIARVIHVRVAQDDSVNLPWIKRETAIARRGFLAMALEQATFEQQLFAVDFEQIHRAGRRARRAEEMDFHGAKMPVQTRKSSAQRKGGSVVKTQWTFAANALKCANPL